MWKKAIFSQKIKNPKMSKCKINCPGVGGASRKNIQQTGRFTQEWSHNGLYKVGASNKHGSIAQAPRKFRFLL